MANYCTYWLKVVSEDEKNLIKFAHHFMSVNDSDYVIGVYYDKNDAPSLIKYEFKFNYYSFEFEGGCPWCGYRSVHETDAETSNAKTFTTLSKELNLTIELFVSGDEFMEHFIIKNGVVIKEEAEDIVELYFEDYDMTTDNGIDEFLDEHSSTLESAGYKNVTREDVREMMKGNYDGISKGEVSLVIDSNITGEFSI